MIDEEGRVVPKKKNKEKEHELIMSAIAETNASPGTDYWGDICY
jgi:hypothetical protein